MKNRIINNIDLSHPYFNFNFNFKSLVLNVVVCMQYNKAYFVTTVFNRYCNFLSIINCKGDIISHICTINT